MSKKPKQYDCSGYVTKYNVLCSDRRVLLQECFAHQDGVKVPLVWEHIHDNPGVVIGHAVLENRKDGVYGYCSFNNNEYGKAAKELVVHGDVNSFSIFAVKPEETFVNNKREVKKAQITEVSLVMAGANPAAKIDDVVAHSADWDDGFVMELVADDCNLNVVSHSEGDPEPEPEQDPAQEPAQDPTPKEDPEQEPNPEQQDPIQEPNRDPEQEPNPEDITHSDTPKDKTIREILDGMDDTKRDVFSAVLAAGAFGQDLSEYETENDKDVSEEDKQTVLEVLNSYTEEELLTLMYVLGVTSEEVAEAKKASKKENKVKHSEETEVNDLFMKNNAFENQNDARKAIAPFFDMEEFDEIIKHSVENHLPLQQCIAKSMQAKLDTMNQAVIQHNAQLGEGETEQPLYTFKDEYIRQSITNLQYLMPEATPVKDGAPEVYDIADEWAYEVLKGVTHFPKNKIKSTFVDATAETARAHGWVKENVAANSPKMIQVLSAAQRSHSAQTIYARQDFDNEDLEDMDYDLVKFVEGIMVKKIVQEKARVILYGDGRSMSDKDKVLETNIRSIANDTDNDGLYTIPVNLGNASSTDAELAELLIDEAVRQAPKYHGSGNKVAFMKSSILSEATLLKDEVTTGSRRRLYPGGDAEIAKAMRVKRIIEVDDSIAGDYLCVIVDLKDYYMGQKKKSERKMLNGLDIDYNKQKYVMEERFTGALIRPKSAFVFKKSTTPASNNANHD